jgi:hypothetical protein
VVYKVKKIDELFLVAYTTKLTDWQDDQWGIEPVNRTKKRAGISPGSRLSGAQLKHLTDVLGIFFECLCYLTDFGIHLTVV